MKKGTWVCGKRQCKRTDTRRLEVNGWKIDLCNPHRIEYDRLADEWGGYSQVPGRGKYKWRLGP